MQIFYPPESLAVFLCFITWPVLQTIAAVICKILPDNFFSPYSFFLNLINGNKTDKYIEKYSKYTNGKNSCPTAV